MMEYHNDGTEKVENYPDSETKDTQIEMDYDDINVERPGNYFDNEIEGSLYSQRDSPQWSHNGIFSAATEQQQVVFTQNAALVPAKEERALIPGSDARPADVLIPSWISGKDTALINDECPNKFRFRENVQKFLHLSQSVLIILIPNLMDHPPQRLNIFLQLFHLL